MEYRNLHHHSQNQLQEQVINGQSSLPILHTDRITSGTGNSWSPSFNFLNNNGSSIVYPNGETMAYSRLWPSLSSPLITTQDLMISYNTTSDHHNHHDDHTRGFDHQRSPSSTNDHEPKVLLVKEEPPDSFSKLKINITPPNNHYYSDIEKSNYLFSTLYNNKPNHHQISDHQDFYSFIQAQSNNNNNSASYGASFKGSHRYDDDDHHDHGQLGHNRTSSSLLCTTPLMLNSSSSSNGGFNSLVQANLDLLISPTSTTTQSCSPSSHNSSANYNNNLSLYSQTSSTSFGHGTGHHDRQEYSRSSPSNSSNMTTSTFLNEVTRTKRPSSSSFSEPKEYSRAESKKSKSMLRTSSNPPLKVRKEKLGDRIASLHRLVAPFGKTDTASVLTEAIGYIQFLHDQVQTLSMPYMKSLQQTKPSRKIQQVHGLSNEEETELNKVDLRSRGLCLVPLSCASYLNGFD